MRRKPRTVSRFDRREPITARPLAMSSALFLMAALIGPLAAQDAPEQSVSKPDASEQYVSQSGQVDGLQDSLQRPIAPGRGSENADAKKRGNTTDLAADARLGKLFGAVSQVDDLPPSREVLANSPASDAVLRAEALGRRTTDLGDLLRRSKSAHGISVQNRTPIITDTRVRGQRVGQVLASGSYWAPARMDLDTMMSKIDSRLVQDVVLIKGPYASRYGPGFRFVDLEFLQSPRFEQGYEGHGSTSATYNTNGEQLYGRQSYWGGNEDYGFHISYGHRTGNDYETGQDDFFIPASYKSRDLFVAFGFDLSDHQKIELNLLRLDQTDVEFPGLVTDLNFLVTDGYEVTYTNDMPLFADRFTAEVWYNRTRFEGDTTRPAKHRQIPLLRQTFYPSSFGADDGLTVTDGDALSGGYRLQSTCYTNSGQISWGTDLIYLNQELNEFDVFDPDTNDNNYPIPRSDSLDIGLYLENISQVTDDVLVTGGVRVDGVFTDSRDTVIGVEDPLSELEDTTLDKDFLLGSAFLTATRNLGNGWSANAGVGFAMRQPTLTEMYSEYTYIGSLQRGLTFLDGDPDLDPERLYQYDLGIQYRQESVQLGAHVHHAYIEDYITYDLLDPAGTTDGFQTGARFVNTDLATLWGMEAYGQTDLTSMFSVFGIVTYLEGRDRSRLDPARLSAFDSRSANDTVDAEPLPGIAPLEGRLGLLIQDPTPQRRWGVELFARVVDNQDRVAATLEEVATPGFTVYNIRTYRRFGALLITGGIENVTDKFYREHLDYRSGLGVFRPGIGFYTGAELTY
ncbi:TonB-dependent receptor [Stieleria sp. ICT_E10.1]|uniref:TonB-dependent receptor n=1 Tax=Stieleria sedimenti TaxID=2976331 RepID=UPI00217FB315|nr:TonB-dependent receptor [Stieleria sedimenti]MCS7467726.1 TonB-dependent receptor [Stieleria sedimenti]